MFAIELMMPEVSVETFLPVAIATGTATFVGRWFFGDAPAFHVPPLQAMAVDSERADRAGPVRRAGRPLAASRRRASSAACIWRRISSTGSKSRYLRHMLGMLIVGVLMYVLFRTLGQYYVDGVGYATIQAILAGQITTLLAARPAVRHARCWRPRSASARAPRAASFRRRCSWAPPSAAAFAALLNAAGLADSSQRAGVRHGRHGCDGGRRHRRGDDRRDNDLRDDPRLQHRHADDRRGGHEHRARAVCSRARTSTP